jgi:NAD(P)H-dependent FMN reductase
MNTNITIISGTNRRNSNSRRVANYLAETYAKLDVSTRIVDLAEIPASAFNPDAYDEIPPEAKSFTDAIMSSAGLHVITPEYNGSFPGALKWFIDLLPFPIAFEGRPVAFVGVAAGEWGGLRPVEQIQQVFGYRNAMQFPKRVFIREVEDKLDGNGSFKDEEIASRLAEQAKGFVEFVRQLKG